MADRNGGKPEELWLIDGNSLAYRAFFALPESIATSTGFPTNAIFGFASMLVKLLTEHGSKPTIVVWDAGASGRKEVYSEYKAQRTSRPDLLKQQWPHLEPIVEAFGYRNVSVEGYEADDVIATIAVRARDEGIPVTVVTGDRDAFQLIDPDSRVKVMATARGITETKMYDHQAVVDRYGIAPEQIPDFYGLKGDTSDNIPGVPGIGDKTASELLQRFGDLETVLASVDEISGAKRKQNLVEHADNARVSKQLATIQRDVPVEMAPLEEIAGEPDRSRLREVFREFELRDPLRRLEEALGEGDAAAPAPAADKTVSAPVREATLADVEALPADVALALAVLPPETVEGELFSREAQFRFGVATADAVLVGDAPGPEAVILATGDRPVSAHDAKSLGAVPARLVHDTLLGAFLLEPARRGFPFRELCEERGLAAGVGGRGRGFGAARSRAGGLAARAHRRTRPGLADGRGRAAAGQGAAHDGGRGRAAQRGTPGGGGHARARRGRGARARDLGAQRHRVHDRLTPAAGGGALRAPRAVAQAAWQDRILHRRARAAGDPRRASGDPEDRALARAQPARQDLPRRAAAARRRARAHPHDVPAGGRHHRPARLHQPEHA